jgi:hypothetical protein
MIPVTPFVYGRPVKSHEFVDREVELRTILNRLRNCESTAVVGEPHIGKSSLLLKIADEANRPMYMGDDAQRSIISSLDLHSIENDYTPPAFWSDALESLREIEDSGLQERLKQAVDDNCSRRSLERLFNYLGHSNCRLVILLDEFDRLLFHSNFQAPSFFALLRSLATRTGGLAIVTATRFSIAEMNELGRGILDTGSPFFNNMIELRLRPFNEKSVEILLDRANDSISADERHFIRRIAGCHPFLIQSLAATLIDTVGEERQIRAAESFYERISYHFDDLWRTMDDRTRTAAVILGLMELGGSALGKDFSYGEIERVAAFGPELQNLAALGFARQVSDSWEFDWQHMLLWRGERWTIEAQSFIWWLRDVAIANTRTSVSFEDWLINKRYRLLLTQEQWDRLIGLIRHAPAWALYGVGSLARALLEGLLSQRKRG